MRHKENIILATVIDLHSCYRFSTRVPFMKDGTSDVGGQKRGRARERALPEECRRGKKQSRGEEKIQRAEQERGTHGEKINTLP